MKNSSSCSNIGKLAIYKNLELFIWYFWGISCVFIVPYVEMLGVNIRFVELSTFLVFIALFIRISVEKVSASKKHINSFLMLNIFLYSLTLFWPIGGVVTAYTLGYTPQLASYIAPFRRLIIIFILLIAYIHFRYEEWLLRERAFIRGFLAGCIVTTVWMIIEQAIFLFFKVPLNDVLYRELLGLSPQHTFINLVGSGYTGLSMSLLRATGFAWDPGQTAPLVALGWLLYVLLPKNIVGKRRLLVSVLMLLALPLSLSRTTIIGTAVITIAFLGIHFFVSIAQAGLTYRSPLKTLYKPALRFYRRSIALGLIAAAIFITIACIPAKIDVPSAFRGFASFVSSALKANTAGEQRHLTYLTLLPPALTLNWTAFFLGYGTANTGIAMEKVGKYALPEIDTVAAQWKGNWNPESTTVTFALMGGVPGFLAWSFCLITSVAKAGIKYLQKPWNIQPLGYMTILLAPFILGLGYGFDNTVIYITFFLMLIHIWDPQMRKVQ